MIQIIDGRGKVEASNSYGMLGAMTLADKFPERAGARHAGAGGPFGFNIS